MHACAHLKHNEGPGHQDIFFIYYERLSEKNR
jgi:hypothetical protein